MGYDFAFLEPHLRVCGGIRRIIEISNNLVALGYKVAIYPEQTDSMDWIEIQADIRPFNAVFSDKIDVLIFNLESQYEIPLQTKANLKVYYILHAGFLYKYPDVCRASYKAYDHRIANSAWTANMVEKEIGLSAGSIPVVGGGINPNHFYVSDVEKEINVLTMGSKKEWKGHETVKQACEIAGVGCRIYDGMGVSQEKMGELYGSARVFVVGAWFEGWCQPAIEAMACGTPLVTTDNGGISDYAINEHNALIVPVKDPQAMAIAITRLLSDEKLSEKLSKNGIITAKKYIWDKVTQKFINTINRIRGGE